MILEETTLSTPAGDLRLVFHDQTLVSLSFPTEGDGPRERLRKRFENVRFVPLERANAAVRLLRAYFDGDLTAIDRIPVDTGGTPFQRRVWEELRRIPAGRPIAYAELARRVGDPRATRAVGTANGANPVAIVVPCHRVVATGGKLGGYGGGLDRKRWLLAHEDKAALAP